MRALLAAEIEMPSLFRFLFVLALLGGAGFVAMAALVAFVEPQPREIVTPLPASAFDKAAAEK